MNRLSVDRRAFILRLLTEGNSVRATNRLSGASKTTILKLVAEFGSFAGQFQDELLINLPCTDIQIDEIWSFCGCKNRNVGLTKTPQHGDVWTWTAFCRDTKLTPSWLVADRGLQAACQVAEDLAGRLLHRPQISTDGLPAYVPAIRRAFDKQADYGRLTKIWGANKKGVRVVTGTERQAVLGNPEKDRICTSHVDRQNLAIRTCNRRFTRLTNAFSKKVENHAAMLAIHFLQLQPDQGLPKAWTAPSSRGRGLGRPAELRGDH